MFAQASNKKVTTIINNFIFTLLLFFVPSFLLQAQTNTHQNADAENQWVDSLLNLLSTDEMIGQLLVVRANDPGEDYFQVIDRYITDYHIGGVTFFGGHPSLQVMQTNHWQQLSNTPLLISIDAEWGPAMRLDSLMPFPYQMTLGAISNDSLIYLMGKEIARQCRRLGIQMNFAPVVDINSNPSNPVIHMRSFGEDRDNVADKGIAYMKGLQDHGIIATAKHFPGHGDTGSDSHLTLPVIAHDKERLDSVELYPFRKLILNGLSGIMVAHLYIPELEKWPNRASTLSSDIVSGLLRQELGFDGLIVTDALDMKGVTAHDRPGVIEVKAITAGNDILLLSEDIPTAIGAIREAIRRGEITEATIRERCRKVLHFKYRAGLWNWKPVQAENLVTELNSKEGELIVKRLFENAVTLVRNDDGLIPLQRLDTLSLASVSVGYGKITSFQERLRYYAPVETFALPKSPGPLETANLLASLENYNAVIVSVQNTSFRRESDYGISPEVISLIDTLCSIRGKRIILDLFATPYALGLFDHLRSNGPAAIVLSYQDHPVMQDVSAQLIFGGIAASGRLPVTATENFKAGTGIDTETIRLGYTLPEELGICSDDLLGVDSIVADCIGRKVFPGCQVVAAKDGKVFFSRSYGGHTYNGNCLVNDFDLYDIASLTKIIATTPAIMQLTDKGLINIDHMLSHYLPYLRGTDKGPIIIREMMAHQSRLWPWIAYYTSTITDGKPDTSIFNTSCSDEFPVRVAEGLYIRKDYHEVMYDTIIRSKMRSTSSYKYSDLGFYFLKDIIDSLTGTPIDVYVAENFYRPLGMSTTGYLPRERFSLDRIIPTENDTTFRNQLIHGDVHDPGAAMLGGVGGHAGLFSNANDLAIFMQMLLNKGSYGGMQYIEPNTIGEFTSRQFPLNDNRRGIGFDKPLPVYDREGPACLSASPSSFGHSGFTGTYCWADPSNGLVYIFLSNRINPDASNDKIAAMDIRPKIHEVFYEAIRKNKNFTAQKSK